MNDQPKSLDKLAVNRLASSLLQSNGLKDALALVDSGAEGFCLPSGLKSEVKNAITSLNFSFSVLKELERKRHIPTEGLDYANAPYRHISVSIDGQNTKVLSSTVSGLLNNISAVSFAPMPSLDYNGCYITISSPATSLVSRYSGDGSISLSVCCTADMSMQDSSTFYSALKSDINREVQKILELSNRSGREHLTDGYLKEVDLLNKISDGIGFYIENEALIACVAEQQNSLTPISDVSDGDSHNVGHDAAQQNHPPTQRNLRARLRQGIDEDNCRIL